jgi:hypothetical protein
MCAPRGLGVFLAACLVLVAGLSAAVPPGAAAEPVSWPVSSSLLLAEVMTGGASASDEYFELYNAAGSAADLGGCEVVYVTATGGTTTRKAAFDARLTLGPGAHLLVANAAGSFASLADATYTGGLAADGGSLVLRQVGGAVIDAVSWGTAANAYVEKAAAPPPPARSSIERRPGGAAGNGVDTNDNSADWFVQSNPVAQPQPSAQPTPSETPTAAEPPTEQPSPTVSPSQDESPATSEPTQTSTTGPGSSATPTVEPTSEPSPAPTAQPTPTATPTARPTATPTAEPTEEPTAPPVGLESIATARSQAVGTRVHLAGVVTAAPPQVLGSECLIAITDESGGIFVHLPSPVAAVEIGTAIDVVGVLAAPYGQLEVRELEWLGLGEIGDAPLPLEVELPNVGEWLEGSLVAVEGTVDSITTDSGRLAIVLGDGQTEVRALADPASGIPKGSLIRGARLRLSGIVGQRATALGRLDGYRLWLRMPADLALVALPSPSPTTSPVATPRPSVAPSSVPVFRDLATGLAVRGRLVDVEATVTAPAGIIDWGGPTIVVDDGTAAVAVVLPVGVASPRVGVRVRVAGKVGSLHSGRRVVATLLEWLGEGSAIQPLTVTGTLGAENEWRLVQVCGRISRVTRAGSRWRIDVTVGGRAVAVLGEPGAGISASGLMAGRLALVSGIVRRSTSDPSSFAVLPRSARDLTLGPAPQSSDQPAGPALGGYASASPESSGGAGGRVVAVADLAAHEGEMVTLAGLIVDTSAGLTLDDGTGKARLGGAAAADALALLEDGDAVEVTGLVSRDAAGLLIDVDPDRIVSVAGAGPDEAAAQMSQPAAPPSAGAGSPAAATNAQTLAGGQAHGLARPSAGSTELSPLAVLAVAGTLVPLLLLGLVVAAKAGGLSGRRTRRRETGPATPAVELARSDDAR